MKVKVTILSFRKTLDISLAQSFIDGFNMTSKKCLVLHFLGQSCSTRVKVKVTFVIFRNFVITLVPLFMDRFSGNYTHNAVPQANI